MFKSPRRHHFLAGIRKPSAGGQQIRSQAADALARTKSAIEETGAETDIVFQVLERAGNSVMIVRSGFPEAIIDNKVTASRATRSCRRQPNSE